MSDRSPNDWAALLRREQKGLEEPGTYARLWKEHEAAVAAEKRAKTDAAFDAAKKLHDDIAKDMKAKGLKW